MRVLCQPVYFLKIIYRKQFQQLFCVSNTRAQVVLDSKQFLYDIRHCMDLYGNQLLQACEGIYYLLSLFFFFFLSSLAFLAGCFLPSCYWLFLACYFGLASAIMPPFVEINIIYIYINIMYINKILIYFYIIYQQRQTENFADIFYIFYIFSTKTLYPKLQILN